MAITHKFDNAYTVTDYTEEMNIIPNQWSLISDSGLFGRESTATNSFVFDKTYRTVALVEDSAWSERSRFNGNDKSELLSFVIPHFTLDDTVTVGDVWNKRKVGTADQLETRDNVLMKKMEQLNGSYDLTMEYARCQAIQGLKYAPNSATINQSTTWFQEFGTTQQVYDFKFGQGAAVDQKDNINTVVAYIQDAWKGGGVMEQVTFYCDVTFFSELISSPDIELAYQYYSSTQEPLRKDLRQGMYRRFEWQGVTFIEYRGKTPDGIPMLPVASATTTDDTHRGIAWAVPSGGNFLTEYYAPAYRFDELGTGGSNRYMWTYEDRASSQIEVMSESNFLVMNARPELIVKCVGGNVDGT